MTLKSASATATLKTRRSSGNSTFAMAAKSAAGRSPSRASNWHTCAMACTPASVRPAGTTRTSCPRSRRKVSSSSPWTVRRPGCRIQPWKSVPRNRTSIRNRRHNGLLFATIGNTPSSGSLPCLARRKANFATFASDNWPASRAAAPHDSSSVAEALAAAFGRSPAQTSTRTGGTRGRWLRLRLRLLCVLPGQSSEATQCCAELVRSCAGTSAMAPAVAS
mmetsp:Transcript_58662/g.168477  ORF Transcript_58662/g.168477 Transcript_58662/m.168477 type:complete len:220 (+) Transcript_58662:622-1281(+)